MDQENYEMFDDDEIMEAFRTNEYGVKLQGRYLSIFLKYEIITVE